MAIINILENRLNYIEEKGCRSVAEINTELLNDVYKEIYDELGEEVVIKIFNMFKGQQITFPVKLNNSKKMQQIIASEYDGSNAKALSLKYGYSEKSIFRIIKSNKNVEDNRE